VDVEVLPATYNGERYGFLRTGFLQKQVTLADQWTMGAKKNDESMRLYQ
jgi:hypothetical protein